MNISWHKGKHIHSNVFSTEPSLYFCPSAIQQEAQLILTHPRDDDAFRGQSRTPNMVQFHMLSMVSYYCSIITL